MRTTIDIDDPILKDLKELQALEGKSLGRLASDLLAQAISERRRSHNRVTEPSFKWGTKSMSAKVNLGDKDALLDAMEESNP